ncbi:MAG: hypothetical protein DCC67_02935 [Planctomycetota bacterium]|nr:MAG: hypothetical protein DCC67_02935 [Planctomycetota bacterium]
MSAAELLESKSLGEPVLGGCRLARARVIRATPAAALVSLGDQLAEAAIAALDYTPSPGDRVLVAGDAAAEYFIIGVLATAQPRPRLKLAASQDGSSTIVSVDDGDLELVAPRGAVRIVAAAGIDATCTGPIDLKSRVAVRLSILDRASEALRRIGLTRSSLDLQHEQIGVASRKLTATAARSDIHAGEVAADVGALTLTARRATATVGTLLTNLGNAYHAVSGLWQLLADRTRMVVKETSHHKAARIYSKAEDVKLKADKIHLG